MLQPGEGATVQDVLDVAWGGGAFGVEGRPVVAVGGLRAEGQVAWFEVWVDAFVASWD